MKPDGSALDRARELLEETSDQLHEEAPCGYVSTLPDGTIVRVNRWVTRVLARPREELLGGVRLQELLTIGGRIYWETHVAPLLRMQGHVEEIALELEGAERRVPVLLNAVLLRDEAGEPLGMRSSLLDVTERRRYERELLAARDEAEEAARIKGTLFSMVSHDIRSPLSALVSAGELLEETELSPEQERYVRVVQRSANSILELVDEVLSLGKLEAGHTRLERKPFELCSLVEGLAEELRLRAEDKGLKLDVEIAEDVPSRLMGDPIKLGRVLTNLIGNAIKFTERGSVRVSVSRVQATEESATLLFVIRDTGIGIAEDELDHIFDDFTQGSEQICARYGGSGLGLGICKKLLGLHGSHLKVTTRPDRGSTFSFELTLDRAPA